MSAPGEPVATDGVGPDAESSPSFRSTAAGLRVMAERSRLRAVTLAMTLGAIAIVLAVASSIQDAPTPPPLPAAVDAGPLDAGAGAGGTDAAAAVCADFTGCDALCRRDPTRVDACVRAADDVRTGRGTPRDLADARARHHATCRATGDAAACTRLGLLVGLLEDRAGAPDWLDPGKAPVGLFAAACEGGAARGRLACAAIELLGIAVGDRAAVQARLRCPLADPAACAADVARDVCAREALPEACYLAALAPSTGAWARTVLGKACRDGSDPSVCHYAWRATGSVGDLYVACSDIDEEPSVARACLDRADQRTARRQHYLDRACTLGSCDGVSDIRTLRAACDAGRLSACANVLARPPARLPRAQRDAALVRAAALAPDVELAVPRLPLPALGPSYQACRYGGAAACDAVVAGLPATEPLRAELEAYARRLRAPLTP